ncbi:MAG: hypothetical protein NVS2B16_29930 [Chloroflexota bacterium]
MTRRWQFPAVILACLIGTALGSVAVTSWMQSPSHTVVQASSTTERVNLAPASELGLSKRASASTDAQIASARSAVRRNPRSASAYTNLALAYMQKERETADVSYYTLTDDTLNAALRIDPRNYEAVNYKAWAALGRHDFALGKALALQAISLNRDDSQNYGTLGDAEANLGDYPAMVKAYQRMVDLKPALASYNRASYVRWLYGDLRGAVRLMMLAIRAGSTQRENVAWCETQLGDDVFNAGFVAVAQQEYAAALHTFPHYARALAGMAAVQTALHHPRAAIAYYRQAIAVVPLPQYVTSLGDLYTALGQRQAARQQYALIAFIDRMFALNHVRYGVETAMFDADHNQNLADALRIARSEAQLRHDIQTDDTLAWVLYKNGMYRQAWHAEQQALRLGTRYAPYFFHAGMIQSKLGNVTEAQSYLHSALMMNPNFGVLYEPVAHAELQRLNARMNSPARVH